MSSRQASGRASTFPAALDGRVQLGAAAWVLTVVFYAGQAAAQVAMRSPYSLRTSYISDLGRTTCGPVDVGSYHAVICSPLHGVMNAAFVAVGLLMALGAIGTRRAWPQRRTATWGLALVAIGGLGQLLVGLVPEDANLGLHSAAALLGIPVPAIGLLLLGSAVWRSGRWVALLSLLCGAVGLLGFLVFVLVPSSALGAGLTERVAVYPTTLWTTTVGAYLLWCARSPRVPVPRPAS